MADVPLMNNPMTTAGDVIYGGASGAPTRLAVGTAGQVLKVNAGATAVEWGAAGSSSYTGAVVTVAPAGVAYDTAGTVSQASRADAIPLNIPGTMYLRAAAFKMTVAATGTWQWGLFDYSSNAAACTKLAGGSGTLNGTGWMTIAASGGPITVSPGSYMFIALAPAANQGTMSQTVNAAGAGAKTISSYAWDDTPDLTTAWSATSALLVVRLVGDLNSSATQW